MAETKTYVFGENANGNGGGMMAMLAPLLQQRGFDPNLLLAMNRNGGFGGEGGWFIWVIFLFFLMGWGRNGWGNGFGGGGSDGGSGYPLANMLNNDTGRELLMSAIQGNGTAISQLASTLNCSVGNIQQAINAVQGQICNVGNQVGMTGQQVINSIQMGNSQIASQLASCCCNIQTSIADCCCKTQNAIQAQGYENQLATCNQTNTLVNTMNANALSLRDGGTANTQAILAKLDNIQNQALLDKIDALREKNTQLAGQLSQEHQSAAIMASQQQVVAPVNAVLGDLSARLAKIECSMPPTVAVPYPQLQAFNPEVIRSAAFGTYLGDSMYARRVATADATPTTPTT